MQGKHKLWNTEASKKLELWPSVKPGKASDRFSLDPPEGPPDTLILAPEDRFWTSEF